MIKEFKQLGKWKINLPKLLLIGLPSIFFAVNYEMLNAGIHSVYKLFASQILFSSAGSPIFSTVFQIIFGYVIATSFYKDKDSVFKQQHTWED
ncbi:MAG: hypothetical protein QM644_19290 [Mobilitalea sp.]